MKIIAFTNNFFGEAKTKQGALIHLLGLMESCNAEAKMIKFSKVDDDTDPSAIMKRGFYNAGSIKL